MRTGAAAVRLSADACPGVTRPFTAADGAIVRVRTAGRPVPVAALDRLLDVVAERPDPTVTLTSRGALQLRGLPDPLPTEVRAAIVASGLVPSATHELARNVVTSPLSGLDGHGLRDIRPLAVALDDGLRADPTLAALPGRFLFALDDGRGDVLGTSFDVGVVATTEGAVVLAGGSARGWQVGLDDAVPLALGLARDFLATRTRLVSRAWHVRELDAPIGPPGSVPVTLPSARAARVGAHGPHAVVAVPLALLTREHVAALRAVANEVVVTPWRSIVVPDGAAALDRFAESGLVVSEQDPWLRLHACTGLPGCARSAVDTRAIAHEIVGRMPLGSLPVHVSGCERRCGAPRGEFVDVLAPASAAGALRAVSEQGAL